MIHAPWLNNFLKPTQSFVVAFDIASSSQNYLNPNGLQRDRERLFLAIDRTQLVLQCVRNHAVGGQFLGDEYRLAFPVTGNHGAISAGEVVDFVDEVFLNLASASTTLGYAPVVRAILTAGPVHARELNGFGYLMGDFPFENISKLGKSVGKEVNILVSDQDVRPKLVPKTIGGTNLFVKSYTERSVPEPFSGSKHNRDCKHYIVISVTNTMHQSDENLILIAQTVLSSVGQLNENLKITIGPSSIVFAVEESQFQQSRKLLDEIQQCASNYQLAIAAAISHGVGRVIPSSGWTTECFESGTAIELCRITSELQPGSLAIPNRSEVTSLLTPLSNNLTQKLPIPGKRDEVFHALVNDHYFGQPAGKPPGPVVTNLPQEPSQGSSPAVPAGQVVISNKDKKVISYIDFDIYLSTQNQKAHATLECLDSSSKKIVELSEPCEVNSLLHLSALNLHSESNTDFIKYGNTLYNAVFSGKLAEKFGTAKTKELSLIRIGISSTEEVFHKHHWELMNNDARVADILSLDPKYSIARIVKSENVSHLRHLDGPIQILIGHACPAGTGTIPLKHLNQLEEVAENAGHQVIGLPKMNFNSLQKEFSQAKGKKIDVLHLICHGKINNDAQGFLMFENDNGDKQMIATSVLVSVLQDCSPSLVVLQACQSGDASSSSDFITGIAETLVRLGIPAVLAFRGKPEIDFAFTFTSSLYTEWLKGQVPIETAIRNARLVVRREQDNSKKNHDLDAWSLPVLYRQPGVFLEIRHKQEPGPEPPEDRKELAIKILADLLKSAKNIFENIKKASDVLGVNLDCDEYIVAKALIDYDCPVEILYEIVGKWYKFSASYRFHTKDAFEFQAIKDLLVIISLPSECQEYVSNAINLAYKKCQLDFDAGKGVDIGQDEDLELRLKNLIRWTCCVLREEQETLPELLKCLLNPDRSPEEFKRILRSVIFIDEPSPDQDRFHVGGIQIDDVAQHIIDQYYRQQRKVTRPVEFLSNTILPSMRNQGQILVMIVKQKRRLERFLQLLQDKFPPEGITCIYLNDELDNSYAAVSHYLRLIDEILPEPYRKP